MSSICKRIMRNRVRGSITVFMSLCLTVCLLFIGTLLESARIVLIRSRVLASTEAAMDSLFAEYDGELFDEFGVLLLNYYELDDSIEEAAKKAVEAQMSLNTDRMVIGGNLFRGNVKSVRVRKIYPVVHQEGKLFARSVLDYMKYRIPVSVAADIFEKLNLIEEAKLAVENVEEMEGDEDEIINEEMIDEETIELYEELEEESILKKIKALRENGYMELILPSDRVVSDRITRKSGFPSNYYNGMAADGNGLFAELADNILFCEYLLEYFSGFTEECENPVLSYELEYILCGNGSDKKNLKESIDKLLLIREGLNILAVYRSPLLNSQADSFAAALAGWTGIAPLVKLVKAAVVGAWAYAESIVDVRTLLSGSPVPFMKGEGEWNLELEQVTELIKGTYLNTGQYEDGLVYQDYMRLLLLMAEETQKYYRTMDMIQCRMTDKKPHFYMNECIYALEIEVTVEAAPVFLRPFGQMNWGKGYYEIKVGAARMY